MMATYWACRYLHRGRGWLLRGVRFRVRLLPLPARPKLAVDVADRVDIGEHQHDDGRIEGAERTKKQPRATAQDAAAPNFAVSATHKVMIGVITIM